MKLKAARHCKVHLTCPEASFKAKFSPMSGARAYVASLRLRNSNAYALVGA
jgi:hypothetical protein